MDRQSEAVRAQCMDTAKDIIKALCTRGLFNSTGVEQCTAAAQRIVDAFGKNSVETLVAIAGVAYITQVVARFEIGQEVEEL